MHDLRGLIALTLVPDIGPVLSRKVLSVIGSPEKVFRASTEDLMSVDGLGIERVKNIKGFNGWKMVDEQLKTIEKKGITAVGFNDLCYPVVLKDLTDAPIVLYMKGSYVPEDRYSIAIVGSRKYSQYGEVVTQKLARELAVSGFTIVSGMARGIDTFSHKSALLAGGRTIAVLGSGVDVCYPYENRGLMERIISSGCVMSEFPPGTPPEKENFPRRNRLISGLSVGVLVVEATEDSGSLITAGYAVEQNREVFAVPGNITSENSKGTNMLIKQGAKIVQSAEDIIEELAPQLKGFIKNQKRQKVDLNEEERKVCNILTGEPRYIDDISRETGLPVRSLLNILLNLELKEIVRQVDGKKFYLVT